MRRHLGAIALLAMPCPIAAQDWNAVPTIELIDRAIAGRGAESEAARYAWQARARGRVTFRAEIGPPDLTTPRLLRADDLEVEVYWESGRGSRQVIRAWRDTTLFPTGIRYHRDHLGIVMDDFGARIRIGDGDEVGSVPHPLAADGPAHYDYQAGDTVTVGTGGSQLRLIAIHVRPRDFGAPLAVGTVYIDADRAVLVRAHLTFTASAYLDPDLEDITVRLERALVEGRYWLPFRQEIAIRRRSAVLDFPLRGVIQAEWEIDDYQILATLPPGVLAGPPIGGLARPGGVASGDTGRRLPSDRLPDGTDLAEVRRGVTMLARGRVLDGLPRIRPSVTRASDVVHVNRVQGLALGWGASWRLGGGVESRLSIGIGTADGRVTGALEVGLGIGGGRFAVRGSRAVADVSDIPVASGVVASLAAQEGGHDYGDYVLLERVGVEWRASLGPGGEVGVGLAREWARSVATAARPARGNYRANPSLGSAPSWIATGSVRVREARLGPTRSQGSVAVELGSDPTTYARLLAEGWLSGRAAGGEGSVRGLIGLGTAGMPGRRSLAIGGRATLPGEAFRVWGGRQVMLARVEWQRAVPWVGLPLGRYGRAASEALVGPFVAAGWAGGPVRDAPWRPSGGVRLVAGLAIDVLNRVVRVELGRPLRGGASVGVTVDLSREWWPIL